MTWRWEDKPPHMGWYAISFCWEVAEGSFVGAAFFDGESWDSTLPIVGFSDEFFLSKEKAEAWAKENDFT